jgi:hypothetical protein
MIRFKPSDRPTAQEVFDEIQERNDDPEVSVSYIGICCSGEEESAESVQSSNYEPDLTRHEMIQPRLTALMSVQNPSERVLDLEESPRTHLEKQQAVDDFMNAASTNRLTPSLEAAALSPSPPPWFEEDGSSPEFSPETRLERFNNKLQEELRSSLSDSNKALQANLAQGSQDRLRAAHIAAQDQSKKAPILGKFFMKKSLGESMKDTQAQTGRAMRDSNQPEELSNPQNPEQIRLDGKRKALQDAMNRTVINGGNSFKSAAGA